MSSTYLITGGAGFIGSFVCERLLAEGHKVICVDNFLTGQRKNIEHLLTNPNFTLLEADVSKADWPSTFNLRPSALDYILHLASPAGPNPTSPKSYHALPVETYLVNSIGTHYLLESAKKHNAVFLFASTSEIYGDPEVHPQPETYWGHVNPIGPRACYDEGKRCAETLFFDYWRQYELPIKVARIFNTYGPNMCLNDGRVVSNFIVQALKGEPITIYGDGSQTRSFCYVDDLIEGFIRMMATDRDMTGPINLGNPNEITIKQLAQKIIAMTGAKSQLICKSLPADDPKQRKPDITKAKHVLNWVPKISIEDGLTKTIHYFEKILEMSTVT